MSREMSCEGITAAGLLMTVTSRGWWGHKAPDGLRTEGGFSSARRNKLEGMRRGLWRFDTRSLKGRDWLSKIFKEREVRGGHGQG